MTGYRRWLTASLLTIASLTPSTTRAQKAITPSDLTGTWEFVASKNLATGTVDTLANHGVNWVQYTNSHWMIIQMENGRKVVADADFAKLSPQEQMKVNYAKVWNDKGDQIFAARGGTYRLQGNVVHTTRSLGLQPTFIGLNEAYTVVRFDRKTMTVRTTPGGDGIAYEISLRRID
jgi:hypothetical protein